MHRSAVFKSLPMAFLRDLNHSLPDIIWKYKNIFLILLLNKIVNAKIMMFWGTIKLKV
jgi:hypothetical protein